MAAFGQNQELFLAVGGLNTRCSALLAWVLAYGPMRDLSIPERFLQNHCKYQESTHHAWHAETSSTTSSR